MKFIKIHPTKQMAVVTGAILVVGAIHLISWRSVAREPKAPLLITQGSLPSPAANNRPANPQDSEQTGPTESPAGKAAPPAGRARFGGALPERVSSRPSLPAPPAPVDIAPARFEAVVYEVEVPENRIADLDAQALEAKAATVRDLATALETFGRAKILYKIDQTVNLYGETITLTTTEPMITATRQIDAGGSINSIAYQQVGLIVNLSACAPAKDAPRQGLDVQMSFELSALVESDVEISPKIKAVSTRNILLRHSETPRFGQPLVLLNVSASGGGGKAPPVAYVVRYVFKE